MYSVTEPWAELHYYTTEYIPYIKKITKCPTEGVNICFDFAPLIFINKEPL